MPLPSTDALLAALPLATPVALVAGLSSRRVWPGLFAGSLALGAGLLVARSDGPLGAPHPARCLELAVPGLVARAPDGGTDLLAAALIGSPAAGSPLDVGWVGLLAAILGLAVAPGALAWVCRVVLAVGLAGLCAVAPLGLELHALLLQLSLATLAGLGLAAVCGLDGKDGALMLVGGLAVVLAGALAVLAISAGSSDPRQLMEPFVERLQQQGLEPVAAPVRDAAALRLVERLDHAAVAAFAAMTVLLLALKARRPWAVGLLAAVALAELFWWR